MKEGTKQKLSIHVIRGIDLVVRDVFRRSSDPYALFTWGNQKVKTKCLKGKLNPEWNEKLTLFIEDPCLPIKLEVFDYDTFTRDDKMGAASFEIRPLLEALKVCKRPGFPNDTIVKILEPTEHNCLAKESYIICKNNRVFQHMYLKLRGVKNGLVELQLELIHNYGARL